MLRSGGDQVGPSRLGKAPYALRELYADWREMIYASIASQFCDLN